MIGESAPDEAFVSLLHVTYRTWMMEERLRLRVHMTSENRTTQNTLMSDTPAEC